MRIGKGFTLIELVIVMLIISAGLLGIASLFGNTSSALSTNEALQQATQYAQECAERVVGIRRSSGFSSSSIISTMCNTTADTPAGLLPPMAAGFSRTVAITTYNGTGSPCPTGTANCKNVVVTVTKAPLSSSITIMLVS